MLNTHQRKITFPCLVVGCHLAPRRTDARREACPPPTPIYISLIARSLPLRARPSAPLPSVGGSPSVRIVPPTHGAGALGCVPSPSPRLKPRRGGRSGVAPVGRTLSLWLAPQCPIPSLFNSYGLRTHRSIRS